MLKSLLVLAGTTVAIPYVITSVSSVLYGWNERRNKVRRTLNPFKVIAFSYTLLQMMQIKLRYIPLYIQWKRFYSLAKPSQVLKVYFMFRERLTSSVTSFSTWSNKIDNKVCQKYTMEVYKYQDVPPILMHIIILHIYQGPQTTVKHVYEPSKT